MSPFTGLIKNCCLNKSKFSSGFAPFKHGKKNKHSEYFSALFCDSHFYVQKRKIFYEFPQKCFKTTKRYSLAVCGSLCGKKPFMLIVSPFTGLIKNSCLNKSKFSTGFSPFKHGKKNTLTEYFNAHWDSHF